MRTVRGLRVDRGFTQDEVAKKLGLVTPQYQGFEAMNDKLEALAQLLEVKAIRIVVEE